MTFQVHINHQNLIFSEIQPAKDIKLQSWVLCRSTAKIIFGQALNTVICGL